MLQSHLRDRAKFAELESQYTLNSHRGERVLLSVKKVTRPNMGISFKAQVLGVDYDRIHKELERAYRMNEMEMPDLHRMDRVQKAIAVNELTKEIAEKRANLQNTPAPTSKGERKKDDTKEEGAA